MRCTALATSMYVSQPLRRGSARNAKRFPLHPAAPVSVKPEVERVSALAVAVHPFLLCQ
jgi:hypothetical protein